MEIEMCKSNRTGRLLHQVTFSERDIIKMTLTILEERIKCAEVALKIIKHSKRKAVLIKLHRVLVRIHQEQTNKWNAIDDELPKRLEGSD